MEKEIKSVVSYFSNFKYPPTFDEVYVFFPKKASKKAVKMAILNLEHNKRIKTIFKDDGKLSQPQRYTIGEYTTQTVKNSLKARKSISRSKLANWKFRAYLKLLSHIRQIKLAGLSGSISMDNAKEDDDIDLFVITAKNRLFTGRFLCLLAAQILGLRRKYGQSQVVNKVCLNLFFDEKNIKIPKNKQTVFVGHEVLQMKPVINRDFQYQRFLTTNGWVKRFFPNVPLPHSKYNHKGVKGSWLGDLVENLLKYAQLNSINRHRTSEIITDAQLWFHPADFEKRLNGKT